MTIHTKTDVVLATPAPVSHRTAEENLGLGALAALLRDRGFNVVLIDAWLEGLTSQELARRILSENPSRWIGFASYSYNIKPAVETLSLLRDAGVKTPIAVGGFGPTFHTDEFLDAGFDLAIRGEGELAALALSEQGFDRNSPTRIPGASYNSPHGRVDSPPEILSANLDDYPLPARDTLELALERDSAIHISSSRGCRAACTFCSISAFQTAAKAPRWRSRSVDSIIEELKQLTARGVKHFKFVDDSFLEPPRDNAWCATLADRIQQEKLDVSLWAYIRADRFDRETLSHLKRAGFISFFVGIENFADSALRRMSKTVPAARNYQALEELQAGDFVVQAGLILFDHHTVVEELEQNLEGFRRFPWLVTKGAFTELYAAEGTMVSRRLTKEGKAFKLPFTLGQNYQYEIADPTASAAYHAMKMWHKAHMGLYDMAIDPLAAPKAISREQMRTFEPSIRRLRELDLDFMEKAIESAKSNNSVESALALAADETKRCSPDFQDIQRQITQLYFQFGLTYDAAENPFIK